MTATELDVKAASPASIVKLYSPRVIVVYTLLANVPVGLFLYGLNLRRRGDYRYGTVMLGLGILMILPILALAIAGTKSSAWIPVGVIAALFLYQLERRPFDNAIKGGATRARWWPPALWIFAALLFLAISEFLILNLLNSL